MNERIKLLRKELLKMSMEIFGEKIGVSKSAISKLESGENKPSEQTIKLICDKFNVRKEWLIYGDGDPFLDLSREEEIARFIGKVLAEEGETFKKTFIRNLSQLSVDEWILMEKLFNKKRG